MEKSIDNKYDELLLSSLEKQIGRKASPSEIINADSDANLVLECMWQLIVDLDLQVKLLIKNYGNTSTN